MLAFVAPNAAARASTNPAHAASTAMIIVRRMIAAAYSARRAAVNRGPHVAPSANGEHVEACVHADDGARGENRLERRTHQERHAIAAEIDAPLSQLDDTKAGELDHA